MIGNYTRECARLFNNALHIHAKTDLDRLTLLQDALKNVCIYCGRLLKDEEQCSCVRDE